MKSLLTIDEWLDRTGKQQLELGIYTNQSKSVIYHQRKAGYFVYTDRSTIRTVHPKMVFDKDELVKVGDKIVYIGE